MRRLLKWAAVAGAILFAPLIWLHATTPVVNLTTAQPADAALIFGALVRRGRISPLHDERLMAGQKVLDAGLVKTLVVSNAAAAAQIMHDHLVSRGVAPARIEIDGRSVATPDTCAVEAERPTKRSVILISQGFHLPRIALQCRNLGIEGQYLAAEDVAGAAPTGESALAVMWLRAQRHTREAMLVWLEILGLYKTLERALP